MNSGYEQRNMTRRLFETRAQSLNLDIARSGEDYRHPRTNVFWGGWCACVDQINAVEEALTSFEGFTNPPPLSMTPKVPPWMVEGAALDQMRTNGLQAKKPGKRRSVAERVKLRELCRELVLKQLHAKGGTLSAYDIGAIMPSVVDPATRHDELADMVKEGVLLKPSRYIYALAQR